MLALIEKPPVEGGAMGILGGTGRRSIPPPMLQCPGCSASLRYMQVSMVNT